MALGKLSEVMGKWLVSEKREGNPFIREEEKIFVRYDHIRIRFEQDKCTITFRYKDDELTDIELRDRLGTYDQIDIDGLDGKVELRQE